MSRNKNGGDIFISQKGMASIKKDIAIFNARMKRQGKKNCSYYITKCGCGNDDCICIHDGDLNAKMHDWNKWRIGEIARKQKQMMDNI